MTLQNDIVNDPNFKTVLDHGFVGLIQFVGSDEMICRAARVSYGQGTKTVRENRGLLRYLMKHQHTSPFEMADVTLHIKLPIFVMRQLVRHRTSSLNEYSARYSVLTDEFYVPNIDNIKPQSTTNKQGRSGEISHDDIIKVQDTIREATEESFNTYQLLLGEGKSLKDSGIDLESMGFDLKTEDIDFSEEFPGIARELARTVMPVAGYTEVFWKQSLHNLFHMLKLRMDEHAQFEIREFAQTIYDLVQPLYPIAFEAFEDYQRQAITLSRMDKSIIQYLIQQSNFKNVSIQTIFQQEIITTSEQDFYERFDLSKREWQEFKILWNL